MWLDRFSNNAGSSASIASQNRSSPALPRRPSLQGHGATSRSGFSPRSSSLNVSAKFNTSTTSLNSSRAPNGSGLRQEILPAAEVTDPLKILEGIVGRPARREHEKTGLEGAKSLERPEVLIEDIDFKGLGLREFLQTEAEETQEGMTLGVHAAQTAEEYEKDKERFEDLHQSIIACDDVLKSVEISLTNFQKDLGNVSAEIETLQSRSTALNTRLENRIVVEKILGPAVEEICIPPALVKKISEDPIDYDWIKALEGLEKRSRAIESKSKGPEKILAAEDVKPLLEDLRNLAIERIRDFLVSQIKSLRSPNINAQIIQQRGFLAYKELYAFMLKYHSQLAEEIAQAYSYTMRWYYFSHFTRYRQALEKMPLFAVEKSDALGTDTQRGPTLSSKQPLQSPNPLSLGRRLDILTRAPLMALPSHIAAETKTPTHIETPFHAFTTAITDNASAEYTFLTTFFPPHTPLTILSQTFNTIFTPTFTLAHAYTKQLIDPTYDCLGLLLCVRITQHHAFTLQRRKCPVADGWINGTNMLLWPRFQSGMDTHIDSVKRATASLSSSGGARATLSLTSSKDENAKGSTAPHPLTQRFGQLLQGILALSGTSTSDPATPNPNPPSTPNPSHHHHPPTPNPSTPNATNTEPIARSLERLRTEVDLFLAKAAKGLQQARRERFLANNYSLVLTIIGQEGESGGGVGREMREWFEGLREGVGGG